eukprot:NODE_7220_length_799_cov_25.995562_g6612_i0.p1 GENE.NODE_7220_length_799_cov_25.995562_g6612_i0~~NODE_7220_length_799_cov_25.995562_g6612_i0.p1  ORF type:complete len:227 (-),score=22.13 NODE_7220_length_799_cov_25.995562_g6612_i0:118-774(-)
MKSLLLLFQIAFVLSSTQVSSLVTFYGARDNCPPGGSIAYPSIHKVAGGTGTYQDPITFAGAKDAIKPGTKIYVPFLSKYFVMEDDCEECRKEWKKSKKWHVDLWMGPSTLIAGTELIACENALTKDKTAIIIDPAPNLSVNKNPLFGIKCIIPAEACVDEGNECGNSCEIPKSATCAELSRTFWLSESRFKALNPGLNCGKAVPSGTSVCMGGTCGD